jgi:hypothetical protein
MLSYTVARMYSPVAHVEEVERISSRHYEMLAKGVREIFGKGVEYPIPSNFGIEIEIEHVPDNVIPETMYWNVVQDASLRNNGVEFVSRPLLPHALLPALSEMDYVFGLLPKGRGVFSHRCSIHVHIDVTRLTVEQVHVLLAAYMSIENLLFNSMFPDRKGNNYCFPLTSTNLSSDLLVRSRLTKDIWKYCAVNCSHMRGYGTIEFRHHPGTKDMRNLFNWIKIISELYTFAQRTTIKDLKVVLDDLNTSSGYVNYVNNLIPSLAVPVNVEEMYDSVTCAKVYLNTIKGV